MFHDERGVQMDAINISDIKGNAQSIFLCNPKKLSVNVYFMKILKRIVTKKANVCYNNLGEENF